jgi:hypothetical protein
VFDPLLGELNRRAVEEMEYFGVHAGVVALGNRTIAFPAGSGAGKSTLVAACLRAGFGYVSDEALCLDYEEVTVVPYPKPLALSEWTFERLGGFASAWGDTLKRPVTAKMLGGSIVNHPSALSDLVRFERQPGPPRLERLPGSQVVVTILEYSFNHFKRPADAFHLATNAARRCQGWRLFYDDPLGAAELLHRTVAS